MRISHDELEGDDPRDAERRLTEAHWQGLQKHSVIAYSEGVVAGKQSSIQQGFDNAFPEGFRLGMRVGRLRGLLSVESRKEGIGRPLRGQVNRHRRRGQLDRDVHQGHEADLPQLDHPAHLHELGIAADGAEKEGERHCGKSDRQRSSRTEYSEIEISRQRLGELVAGVTASNIDDLEERVMRHFNRVLETSARE